MEGKIACERCGNKVGRHTMSFFNTETICLPCSKRERTHPKFPEARQAEETEIAKENYNFPGIGCPDELYQSEKTNEN